MSDRELLRKIHGRVRELRRERRKRRIAGYGAIGLVGLAAFATVSSNLIKREKVDAPPPQAQQLVSPPTIPYVFAQAEPTTQKKSTPKLLDLDRLFPKFRKKSQRSPQQPAQNDTQQQPEPLNKLPDNAVVLDDLRAAPPKTVYLDAIFEPSTTTREDPLPPIQLSIDFTNSIWDLPTGVITVPAVPEPGTGLLLGLGLCGVSAASRHRRRRYAKAQRASGRG